MAKRFYIVSCTYRSFVINITRHKATSYRFFTKNTGTLLYEIPSGLCEMRYSEGIPEERNTI